MKTICVVSIFGSSARSIWLRSAVLVRPMKRSQPVPHRLEPASSRAKMTRSTQLAGDRNTIGTAVAYITCPAEAQDFRIDRNRHAFMKAVNNAIEAGADLINISLGTKADTSIILPELTSTFDAKWTGSVGQPAYSCRCIGLVMSFFSDSCGTLLSYDKILGTCGTQSYRDDILDPEESFPAILLTFSTPAGILCAITTSLPVLPSRARARLLNVYVCAASDTKAETILIGGVYTDNILFLENQVTKLNVDFELFTNDNLCLLAHGPDLTFPQCFPLDTEGSYSLMAIWDKANNPRSAERPTPRHQSAPRSAERPAPRHQRETRCAVTLRPFTPLYDNLIANLEPAVQQNPRGHAFIDYITECCFFSKLLMMDAFGQPIDKPVPLAVKMEELLRAARRQRELHLEKLKCRQQCCTTCINEEDMKAIYNGWRHDVQSWMQDSTLEIYEEHMRNHQHQQAHQLGKKAFNTYLFQLSGCKFLLHKLIQLPLISTDSVEQPVGPVLVDLIYAYEEHKRTPQYHDARKRSAEHQAGQKRLSNQIWWAQYNYTQGRKLSLQVQAGDVDFFALGCEKQQLVDEFDTRRSAKALDRLLEQDRPSYRGAGSEVTDLLAQ